MLYHCILINVYFPNHFLYLTLRSNFLFLDCHVNILRTVLVSEKKERKSFARSCSLSLLPFYFVPLSGRWAACLNLFCHWNILAIYKSDEGKKEQSGKKPLSERSWAQQGNKKMNKAVTGLFFMLLGQLLGAQEKRQMRYIVPNTSSIIYHCTEGIQLFKELSGWKYIVFYCEK